MAKSVSDSQKIDYRRRQRHILLDMHVPDFDDRFLRRFDPARNVELYARAGADSVMVYCNSIVGLSYCPTEVGQMHPGLGGRDVVGETVALLHERDIAACAYYSVNFNNWAFEHMPACRTELAGPPGDGFGNDSRFGICCPASDEFRRFARAQVAEIARAYEFDAFFLDMMFWPGVCVCRSCRDRYREEAGAEVPEVLDWWSPAWCTFQAARERWLAEQFSELSRAVKRHRAIPVFNNNAPLSGGWRAGVDHALLARNDVLGGDLIAGPGGLCAFAHLGASHGTFQYMSYGASPISGAVQLRSVEDQQGHALVATALGGQFMAIDAVLPDGAVHAPAYEQLADVFDAMKPYESFLGGRPVADVGVYYSLASQVDFADNGTRLADLRDGGSPHANAACGACLALQRAHIPAGVITRADLDGLDAFGVVVLPNVLRMDEEEVAAVRRYVERGGRVYASGWTSLVSADGVKHPDFALADVFGCRFERIEPAAVSYVRPLLEELRAAIEPTAVVPHGAMNAFGPVARPGPTALLVRADRAAVALAALTLPYGQGRGTRADRAWASSLTSPPWEDTDRPVIVEHGYGAGRVVYSACDLESSEAETVAAQRVFVTLVRRLLGRPATVEAETHPNVWIVAFHEPELSRLRIGVLNHQLDGPPLPVPRVSLTVTPPEGGAFTRLTRLPDGEPLELDVGDDGRLHTELRDLRRFEMLAAEYRPERPR